MRLSVEAEQKNALFARHLVDMLDGNENEWAAMLLWWRLSVPPSLLWWLCFADGYRGYTISNGFSWGNLDGSLL